MSTSHEKAAKSFLADAQHAAWHDKALYFVREKRDLMAKAVPEWEELRELSSHIKQHTLSHLSGYLEEFEHNAVTNGIQVHWAKDAEEHNNIVLDIIRQHQGKRLIKSKSMLTEECKMAPHLRANGITITESDLGEYIMQLLNLPPSHIVLPAINVTREQIGQLFEEHLNTEPGNTDPTYLTHAARKALRAKFLTADIAMTGVNFAVASTGAFVVCTNEGNADMGTSFAKVHIASMGLEKVIPDYDALGVFVRLLARSGTGQPITAFTSHYKKPAPGKEIHVIIVDNGRSNILNNTAHVGMLKCLRCGACMDTCPVYRRSGGYSYSYFIPGPLGINLGMLHSPEKHSGNLSACSLCYSCSNVCPAKIDLAEQIYLWRQDLDALHLANPEKRWIVKRMKWVMDSPSLFYKAIHSAGIIKHLPRFMVYNHLNKWGQGRELPTFAPESFNELWKNGKVK